MTRLTFMALCGEFLIDPGIALENEEIQIALSQGDDKRVRKLLKEAF